MKTPLVFSLLAVLASGTCQGYQWRNELEPPTAECTPNTTQCVAESAQLCVGSGAQTVWREHTNCAAATPYVLRWECCPNEAGEHVCLPHDTCITIRASRTHNDAGVSQ